MFILLCADDSVILKEENTRSALEYKVNENMRVFTNICSGLHLQISADKSEAILFGRKDMKSPRPIFKLDGRSISVISFTFRIISYTFVFSWTAGLGG